MQDSWYTTTPGSSVFLPLAIDAAPVPVPGVILDREQWLKTASAAYQVLVQAYDFIAVDCGTNGVRLVNACYAFTLPEECQAYINGQQKH